MISSIQSLVDKYLHLYPAETEDLKLLLDQLEQSEDITSRKNFVGHVTASGFIINENSRQVLLLKHKSLGKLLQPGGHIETHDESFTDAALREIEEETGLKRSELRLRSAMPGDPEVPFDIDSHYIPNNEKKQEPAHYHHDFRYVYTTTSSNVIIDATESTSYKWIDWEDFSEAPNFTNIADKINSTLEPNASGFFRSLTKNDSKKLSVIAVAHIIPSSEDYIRCLREDFNLIGIIPKPKSINQASEKRLLEEGTVLLNQFSRASINNNLDELISFLQPFDNICIVDIGGYFSNCMAQLKQALGSKLLGVVEDTENGLQKYENNLTGEYAVMSVARSHSRIMKISWLVTV